eukprot:Gb_37204 [translate_table: standard]
MFLICYTHKIIKNRLAYWLNGTALAKVAALCLRNALLLADISARPAYTTLVIRSQLALLLPGLGFHHQHHSDIHLFIANASRFETEKHDSTGRSDAELQGNKGSRRNRGDLVSQNATVTRYVQSGRLEFACQVFERMLKRDVVSRTAMIAGYVRNGRVDGARKLFDKMPGRNVATWNAIISGYIKNGRLEDACQLFDKMPKRNVVSWTAMVTGYARHGRLEDAKQLFDKMPERNVVSWNAMLTGYVQNGRIEDAQKLFDDMPGHNVISWNAMITGYVQDGRISDAHHMFEKMPERDVVSWTALITGYLQNGRTEDARCLFDKMPIRNVVSWTAMIAGYAQNGHDEDALKLFSSMHREGIKSNQPTFTTVLNVCASLAALEEGKQVHNHIIVTGFELDDIVADALLIMYVKCRSIDNAHQLFNTKPAKNVVSWNAMITGYAQNGKIEDARHVFDRMPKRDVVSWTSIISGYFGNGRIKDAQQLFGKMTTRDDVCWSVMIAGFAQNGHGEEALKHFCQMKRAGMKATKFTFTSLLNASANLTTLEQGKQIHAHIIKMEFLSDIFLENALMDMYAKCGTIDDAHQVFKKMPNRDVVSYNSMIVGFAQHGYIDLALQLMEQMQQTGLKPDHITFIGVLSACNYAGLVDEGWYHFDSMSRDHYIQPRADHYTCMVDLLGRAGCLDEAEYFIRKMPFEPHAAVWGSLLAACRIHVNIEIGKRAAERLFELEPQNATPYVVLSNIFAAAGRWNDEAKVRTMRKDRRVKKNPGCSWIEVKRKVHSFLAGDITLIKSEALSHVGENEWADSHQMCQPPLCCMT